LEISGDEDEQNLYKTPDIDDLFRKGHAK